MHTIFVYQIIIQHILMHKNAQYIKSIKNMITNIKPATKIDVQATLLKIGIGKSTMIKTKTIKASSIRSAIRVLNKKGYDFDSTEKGLIDVVRVTRNK